MKAWLLNHVNWMDEQLYQKPSAVNEQPGQTITEFKLHSNYPNPFNPSTKIKYSLPENGFVTLKVFNTLGQEVTVLVNQHKNAGEYAVDFDASKLASGIHMYKLETANESLSG